jgi:nicotinate-nucleotide--dimethylbenzimidazole phosphoribosyltransferase
LKLFLGIIDTIRPLDAEAMAECQLRLDNLTKPLGSLHGLEQLACKIAGITGNPRPTNLMKSIILMAADHGVADEGVSAYPREVTQQMIYNFLQGGAAINILARHIGADLVLVDVGVAAELPCLPGLRNEKVAFGTQNMAKGPAMTREQAIKAIEAGIRVARDELARGVAVLGLGDMGIGNTTPSTAIIAVYAGAPVDQLVGRGTGISDAVLEHKIRVIEQALAINDIQVQDPLDVLAKVGGLEIAGLVGVILAGAAGRGAVVIDGVIAAAAALIAVKITPAVRDYLIGSHVSVEPAHQIALKIIEVPAYLHLQMRLGEGTGAALGMTLIDGSLHVLNDMKTFGEAQVAIAQDGPGAHKQRSDI